MARLILKYNLKKNNYFVLLEFSILTKLTIKNIVTFGVISIYYFIIDSKRFLAAEN